MASTEIKQHVPVFVSSTYEDLIPYREEVQRSLIRLEQIIKGMEYFGSAPQNSLITCLQQVKESKLFISILGMRYGSVDDETGLSYSQMEYNEAIKNSIPTLIYIMSDEQPIPFKYVDIGEKAKKLAEFKEYLKKQHTVSFFTFLYDLGKKIIKDVMNTLSSMEKISVDKTKSFLAKSENDNLKDEIGKLKETLNLNTILSDKVYMNATVVTRNIDYWYNEITIDKGSKNGIEKGMAVVVPKGLIGQITKVSNYTSTVKLLSNENMSDKISVKIKVGDNYVYGLISAYDAKTNTYTVEGISENVKIEKDADVVTTGMGTIFPSGLIVGKVKEVTTDNFDLSKVVEVKSSVDFNDIDYVTVLKRKSE